jgi:hypothetical protein
MKIAALVIIETDDAALDPDLIDVSTASKATELRATIIAALPGLERVVMVMDEDTAKLMCMAHDVASEAAGLTTPRPPPDYRSPRRH